MDKAVITCAINGIFTDPQQHPVPVTPDEMATAARDAYNAGASIMHVHFRDQRPGRGNRASWDPIIAAEMVAAIRQACPDVIINNTTGVVGPNYQGSLDCIRGVRPEIAACNAGSLNYLKLRANGEWAWPPLLFDNSVEKIQDFLDVMKETNAMPEFECFDVGIVRSVGLYLKNGMTETAYCNFVMGVASGMPVDKDLLRLLPRYIADGSKWEATLIGRKEIWPVHQEAAELGGMLRTGVEDTFYLPNGEKTTGNGPLIKELVECARRAGREVASPAETRTLLGLPG